MENNQQRNKPSNQKSKGKIKIKQKTVIKKKESRDTTNVKLPQRTTILDNGATFKIVVKRK